MKGSVTFWLVLFSLLLTSQAQAGTAEARETARLGNCAPKKIQVYEQTLGATPRTIYRVDCTPPKTTGESKIKAPTALLISCDAILCNILRTVQE